MYQTVLKSEAVKFLDRKVDRKTRIRIAIKIDQLAIDPFATNTNLTKMKDLEHGYRLRVGNVRVTYSVDTNKKVITVWKIDWRDSAYKN